MDAGFRICGRVDSFGLGVSAELNSRACWVNGVYVGYELSHIAIGRFSE